MQMCLWTAGAAVASSKAAASKNRSTHSPASGPNAHSSSRSGPFPAEPWVVPAGSCTWANPTGNAGGGPLHPRLQVAVPLNYRVALQFVEDHFAAAGNSAAAVASDFQAAANITLAIQQVSADSLSQGAVREPWSGLHCSAVTDASYKAKSCMHALVVEASVFHTAARQLAAARTPLCQWCSSDYREFAFCSVCSHACTVCRKLPVGCGRACQGRHLLCLVCPACWLQTTSCVPLAAVNLTFSSITASLVAGTDQLQQGQPTEACLCGSGDDCVVGDCGRLFTPYPGMKGGAFCHVELHMLVSNGVHSHCPSP